MKRLRDLAADDVRTPTTNGSFHIPLAKRYRGDAPTRRDEMRMCVHAHILRALEVFSVIATTATLHTDTPASAAAEERLADSSIADESDEEQAFVLGLLGLDTNSDEEYDLTERVCCLLVLNLVSSTLSCIRRPRPRLLVLDVCGFV
jgi:hypothetical protein